MPPNRTTIFLEGKTALLLDDLLVTVDEGVSGEYGPAGHAAVQSHSVLALSLLLLLKRLIPPRHPESC